MDVRFEVKDQYYFPRDTFTTVELKLIVIYDSNNLQHKKISYALLNRNNSYGFLGHDSAREKFNIGGKLEGRLITFADRARKNVLHNQSSIVFPVRMPRIHTTHLLQLLSIVHDAITFLKNEGMDVNFNVLDIIKRIAEKYKENNEGECQCALVLDQLIAMISNHDTLSHHDAILLSYCFSAFTFDTSFYFTPNNLVSFASTIVNTIDKTFSFKFIKPPTTTMSNADYQIEKDKDRKLEVNEFLRRLYISHKIKLYEPCLGKTAPDNGLYTWSYTEWYFLRDAKFTVTPHAQLFIDVSKDNNPQSGYSRFYAYNRKAHDRFENELRAFTSLTELSFEDDINYHHQLIFTANCSQNLIEMGLHLDVDNIKKLVLARNGYRFFQEASQSGVFNERFSTDIIRMIFTLVYGRGRPLLSMQEVDEPKHLSYVMR